MAKIMTQIDLLTKHVMQSGYKIVNVVGSSSRVSRDDAKFEALYNKEIQFLSSQVWGEGGSRLSYPRSRVNQDWNRDRDYGKRDRDRNWHDRCTNWRDRGDNKEGYVPP
ncbi:hypothetical protein MTR67_052237 [Solanum verrucosum]|uniref:Uncharacterized protein n=1 Tax=Solanum verrucosum TaxID=315347 RepID=A0AAF0V5U6_SOLVR|nr:hypothetical protein MTR67_052237 [Solanum verrucosum]